MPVNITLIRHGKTAGNLRGAYIGKTDEPLCPEGKEALVALLQQKLYPTSEGMILLSSPLRRCLETAELLFPGVSVQVVPDFRETDFGDFEGKSYQDLNGNDVYQKWIDSGGKDGFPGGETPQQFQQRCVRAFSEQIKSLPDNSYVVIVCHGGTIMAILDAFSDPHRDFYDWQVKNGCGYTGCYDPESGLIRDITPIREQEEH